LISWRWKPSTRACASVCSVISDVPVFGHGVTKAEDLFHVLHRRAVVALAFFGKANHLIGLRLWDGDNPSAVCNDDIAGQTSTLPTVTGMLIASTFSLVRPVVGTMWRLKTSKPNSTISSRSRSAAL